VSISPETADHNQKDHPVQERGGPAWEFRIPVRGRVEKTQSKGDKESKKKKTKRTEPKEVALPNS